MAKKIRPSNDYWRRRETRQRRKNIKDQQEYDKHIESIYQKSMDNIQKEIDSFYVRYARKESITLAEAKKRASKLDMEEYSRKAKRYVEERDFSKQANEEMRLYNMTMKVNRLELLKAKIGLELADGFNDLQKFFDRKLTDRTLDEFKRQAGILGDTVTDTEVAKRAKVLVNASFHNAKWSDRIWMHQDLLKNKLDGLLRTGLIQGRNPRELARELRKAFGASVNDSERLMRTEMARVQTAAQQESFERNGFKEYEYICCGLPDACEICRALDGKIFKVKDMMVGENAPPMHPNCHCSTAAAAANREDFDAWLNAKATGETGLGFEEWVSQKSTNIETGLAKAGITKANGVFVNNTEQLARFAKKIKPEEGFSDFTCHSDGVSFYIDMTGNGKEEDYLEITPEELAKHIKDSKEYQGGPVRIISCKAGSSDDGAAKRLAEALGDKVKAPTEDIHVEENGEIFISDNDTLAEMWYTDVEHRSEYKSTGAWRTFDP